MAEGPSRRGGRQLVVRAATGTTTRPLCRRALESMNARRDLYFTADELVYAELDDR